MKRFVGLLVILVGVASVSGAGNLSISSEPYLTGGLFTNPVLPHEDEPVTITVRAECSPDITSDPKAQLTVLGPDGETIAEAKLTLARQEEFPGVAQATWSWSSDRNGLFMVRAVLDPENAVEEDDETDNTAELTLPVIVKGKGRDLHFVWYRENADARWSTCVTSIGGEPGTQERLAERGVMPLRWEYGGMSWKYYDKENAENNPDDELAKLEALFYEKFTSNPDAYGFGIDEVGGYPGTWSLAASVASMKALARAKAENPDRFFAVWNGGGPRPELTSVVREGADLFLLETYLWRALPDELGTQDIYQSIVSRVEPYIRATDMFQPAYGNHCYTLIGLDTSERPDRCDPGELEQVIRFIRRRVPEMRGIAWYTGGYGGYGLERTPETDRHHAAIMAKADQLGFDYWVKPCVTLMPESLWLTVDPSGSPRLVAAISNIGSIDSKTVSVEFLMDGLPVGVKSVDRIPAGPGRNANTVQLGHEVTLQPGPHRFEARIVSAPDSTVLDPIATCDRFVP